MAESTLINPYEQIWKTRDLRALDTPIEVDSNLSSFERGLGRFGNQMEATAYGLTALGSQAAENVIGENEVTKGITDWGLKGYKESIDKSQSGYNAPKVIDIEHIKTASDAMDWAAGTLGEQLPMAASLVATGGIGGAVARLAANKAVKELAGAAVGALVKTGVEKGALKAVEGQVVTEAMQKAAAKALLDTTIKGATVGAGIGTAGLEGGLAFGEQVNQGAKPTDAVKSAIAVGGINGALELVTPYVIATRIGLGSYAKNSIRKIIEESPDLAKKAIGLAKELGTRAIAGVGEGMKTEGITEGLQELTSIAGERWAKQDSLFAKLTDEDWSRIKNSAAAGAFTGGVLSGAGATLGGPEVQQTTPAPINPDNQTKVQILEALQDKANKDIISAQAEGDTAKVEQLQKSKDLYNNILKGLQGNEQPTDAQVINKQPVVEQPVTEQPPVIEQPAAVKQPPVIEQPPIVDNSTTNQAPVLQTNEATQQTVEELKRKLASSEETANAPLVESSTQETPTPPKSIENSPVSTAQGITAAFGALGSGIDAAARIKARDNILANIPHIFKNPAAIVAVKANPNYVLEDLQDGSVQVVGVLDPDTNSWVGKQPSVQQAPVGQASIQQPTTAVPFDTQQSFNDIIKQEEEKLVQLVQRKEELSPSENTQEFDQVIKDQEELLAQLAQSQEVQPKETILPTPAPIQDAALPGQDIAQPPPVTSPIDPWLTSELEFDIKTSPSTTINDIADKWGQDIADAVSSINPDEMTSEQWADLATKAKPQQEGNLASLIKNGQPIPAELGGTIAENLVKNDGYSPNTIESLVKLAPDGWELSNVTKIANDPPIPAWNKKGSDEQIAFSAGQFVWWDNIDAEVFDTYDDLIKFLDVKKADSNNADINNNLPPPPKDLNLPPAPPPGDTYNNNSNNDNSSNPDSSNLLNGSPDLNYSSSSTTPSQPPVVLPGNYAPVESLPGYELKGSYTILTPEETKIDLNFNPSQKELAEISYIHDYLKHAPISFSDKVKLFKEFPTTKALLAAFKTNHPYLIRKVSIEEAATIDQAKVLLNDILMRRDKYSFDEILGSAIKFQEKYGDEEFIAALASTPTSTSIGAPISPAPHLDGWLVNMRAEDELLNENPFEGIWADYEVNTGPNASAARYGIIIINPKTGKVLLRKVANQFEGIIWDFARGGADRFGDPNARPNLIDTNVVSIYPVTDPNKRYMEHPLVAAKREAREEFGYDVKVIGQLAKGFYTSDTGYEGKMASLYYVAVPVSEQTNEHLQPTHGSHVKETDDTQWVDLQKARRLIAMEPTLPLDSSMKRDGKHKARTARIARTLEAVFNPAMQKSDLDYHSSYKGMEKYFNNGLSTEFPNILPASAFNKSFDDLTELQKMQVAAALYVSKRFPNADPSTKSGLQKELLQKRKAGLQSWLKDKVGTVKLTDIMQGNASLDNIQNKLNQTGGKIVLSLWHGTNKTREALLGDVIDPVYFGSAWGGHDTKEGMYLAGTKQKAKEWGAKSQVNMLVAFNNLKVVPGTTNYDAQSFSSIIKTAKNQGYDGVLFDNVNDVIPGRQVVVWNMENITSAGGMSAGFTGSTLYQSKGELGERMDVNTAKTILEDTFGNLTQKMLDSGLLEIVESGGPDGIAGQYFGEEQKIKVYLDYISSPRELIGAVLHEGAHAGMREILDKSAEVYHKELLQSNKPIVKYAIYKTAWEGAQRFGIENSLTIDNLAEIERVRSKLIAIDPNFLIEEDLANFVQQADTSSSLWKKIVNAIKIWWAQSAVGKLFKEQNIGFELTEEMAVGLITAAMRAQTLRRGNDYSTYVGHVSGADWKVEKNYPYGRPDLKYVLAGGGEGNINYGWGLYVFESLPTYQYYKSTINNGVGNKTYGLHLPDDIPPRMLEWDRELTQQSSIVKDAITSPRDNYLLLRMAVKSKDRKSSYPGDNYLNLEEKGTGGALFNQLRDYYHKVNWNDEYKYATKLDPITGKQQQIINLARRDASKKLAEYGLSGVRLLDAGSRKIIVTRLANGMYQLTRGTNHPKSQTFSEADFIKQVGPDLAAKVKTYPIGVSKNHAGFGFYNWIFWRQSDLDRFTVVYKNGNQVADKPSKNAAYDPNGIGIPYPENPGFADYVIEPKTGEKNSEFYSKSDTTLEVSLDDLRNNIDSVMGNGWLKQAEEAGLVEVIEGVGPKGEAGSWAGDKLRLYSGSMPAGSSPIGVLLHEGKHATFKEVLGESLNSYVSDLRTLANNGNQAARDAIVRATVATADILGIEHKLKDNINKIDLDAVRAAIEERRPGLLAEEELAYFVQYGTETQSGVGFLHRLINQIKAWFAQTKLGQRLKEMGIGFEMTDGMAVEWAKMGLHKSLAELRKAEQVKAEVLYQAAYMPASTRLGKALEATYANDTYYSMGIQEIKQSLWTDPTDSRVELVNKPGLLQRIRADFVDFFAEMEKKSNTVYEAFSLLRSKKAARIEQSRQEYFLPLRELITNSPWTAQEVGDMLAARHIKVDKVNIGLAERASDSYVKDLIAVLPKGKQAELTAARKNIKDGKMPDGADYTDINGNKVDMTSATKRKLMFDLMNKYAPFEIINSEGKQALNEEWELFKDAAGGFSTGGVGKNIVRTVDDVLKLANKDREKFNKISNLFDAANRHTLDILEEGGLITAAEHARLLADKTAYAPLRRKSYDVNREIEQLFQRAGQGGSKQIATRSGTASLSEPTLVLQNALAKIEAAAAAAERNLANKELYKVINNDRENWKPWFSIVDKDKYVTHDEDGFLQEKNATASSQADIVLINDGKKLIIRPNMHNERAMGFVRAANNLDAQILSGPMKVLGWLNGIVRWVNVSASPVFLMMNAIRDPFTAAYNLQASEAAPYTKAIFQNYGKAFKALKKVFLDGNRDPNDLDVQWVERWESAGGRTSFVESLKEMDTTWRSFDAQVARRQGSMKQLMAAKDKWIDGLENFNILFENVMRFSTFKVLAENSAVSDSRAAKISQDLTTNFSRRGYKTQALGVWWLFFNATVQGNYQVLRNLMESKRVQVAVGGTIVMALMLDLLGRELADDWDKIPDWDKERFIILPIKIGGDFIRIPAPWVYNVVWRMGSLLGETLAQVKKPQDALLDLAAMTATAFSPLGKPGSIAQAIAPTGADPFVQILENKDFAGNPLGPEGYPGAGSKANSELLWSSTPKGYQSIARFVNEFTGGSATEPGVLDYRPADYQVLVKFLTGSLGRFMSDATFGIKESIEKGIEGPKDIPIIKELFSDAYNPMRSQKYHTNIAGIYGAYRLEQMYLKGPDKDLIKLHEVRQERREELRMYKQAQDIEKQLKSLRVRLKAAQNREDRNSEKEIRRKMEYIQDQFNLKYQQRIG